MTETASSRQRAINRSWLVRLGKRLRKRINPYLKHHSKVGDTAILDRRYFPWIDDLENDWTAIRDEALAVLRHRAAIPPLADLSPDHRGLDDQRKWRSFFLWGYGFRVDENCARCPATAERVERIPGLKTALFSIHEPGMAIPPHRGVTASMCILHLGLKVPRDRANCAIRVDAEIRYWKEGEAFVFDDTRDHETWNRTGEDRVILLVQFDRPLRFPASLVAWIFMQAIRRSAFVGDARKRLGSWDAAFRRLEKADE
ncbi:MAG: aspartyl/asparaginyl beta-hydroxylase domain-containing protein [Pseudomonadota bacterium]